MGRALYALTFSVLILAAFALILVSVGLFDVGPANTPEPNGNDSLLEEYRPLLKGQRPMIYQKDDFEQLSPWQKFVTPDAPAIMELASSLDSVKGAYIEAVSWTWVSDDVLNGQSEKWLMPNVFLADTPSYPRNPVKGREVSDCEEQAYSLVSLLRAYGVPATDVRVVVGEVMVEGDTGGHAWVEILQEGQWLQLEATSGPYWDEDGQTLVSRRGGGFLYYTTHDYPVVDIWGYFNDVYYYNPVNGVGNAPEYWR
ncbi:MAG: transglutaminase domain-containing protein [Candidatus Methanofastidiosa archaeon]|nr:transglutaminase domain-containing protein [Candidatus Methanofastidiosa archaeon]